LIFQFIVKQKFDVAHYIFTPTTLNSFIIKKIIQNSPTKTIQTVATLREDVFSDEELKNLMFADLIITYSDYAQQKLFNLGVANVRRVYPGIDLEKYQTKQTRQLFSEYSDADFVINFAGEYTRLGAMDDVIEAFIEVSKKIPTAKLSMAVRVKNEKDTAKKKEVVERLQQNNLLDKVVFHDNGKFDMSDIYNLCDISIFPVQNMRGKFDVPLVVIEAMACEKPVILSDLPILQEFSNAQNSIQIKAGDVSQLTEAIVDLYNNPEKRKSIGASSRKYVEQNFDIRKVASQYAEIYKQL